MCYMWDIEIVQDRRLLVVDSVEMNDHAELTKVEG
mgnify:CR=1 FL=1